MKNRRHTDRKWSVPHRIGVIVVLSIATWAVLAPLTYHFIVALFGGALS